MQPAMQMDEGPAKDDPHRLFLKSLANIVDNYQKSKTDDTNDKSAKQLTNLFRYEEAMMDDLLIDTIQEITDLLLNFKFVSIKIKELLGNEKQKYNATAFTVIYIYSLLRTFTVEVGVSRSDGMHISPCTSAESVKYVFQKANVGVKYLPHYEDIARRIWNIYASSKVSGTDARRTWYTYMVDSKFYGGTVVYKRIMGILFDRMRSELKRNETQLTEGARNARRFYQILGKRQAGSVYGSVYESLNWDIIFELGHIESLGWSDEERDQKLSEYVGNYLNRAGVVNGCPTAIDAQRVLLYSKFECCQTTQHYTEWEWGVYMVYNLCKMVGLATSIDAVLSECDEFQYILLMGREEEFKKPSPDKKPCKKQRCKSTGLDRRHLMEKMNKIDKMIFEVTMEDSQGKGQEMMANLG